MKVGEILVNFTVIWFPKKANTRKRKVNFDYLKIRQINPENNLCKSKGENTSNT